MYKHKYTNKKQLQIQKKCLQLIERKQLQKSLEYIFS